jgi:hypothetical protein
LQLSAENIQYQDNVKNYVLATLGGIIAGIVLEKHFK